MYIAMSVQHKANGIKMCMANTKIQLSFKCKNRCVGFLWILRIKNGKFWNHDLRYTLVYTEINLTMDMSSHGAVSSNIGICNIHLFIMFMENIYLYSLNIHNDIYRLC